MLDRGGTTQARRPGWLVVLVLVLTAIIATVQFPLVIPLVPTFPEALDAPVADTLWVLIAPLLTGTVSTPVFGRLADMYGKRRMLLICLGFVAVGNVVGLLATTVWPLVASRAIVGIGMAVIPLAIAILRDELPAHRLAFGIAVMSTTVGVSSGVGLPLGGWLDQAFGYHSIFWVSLAATVIVGLGLPFAVRESPIRSGGRFDVIGATLLVVALLAFLVALSRGGDWGWLDPRVLGLGVVAVVAGGLWLLQERRAVDPVVDLGTSLSRPILVTNLSSFAFGLAIFGNMLVTMSQVQLPEADGGFGLDTFDAGLVMLPAGAAAVLGAPIAGLAVQRFGARRTVIAGALVTAAGYLFRMIAADAVWQIALGAAIIQFGVAIGVAGFPAIITRYAPITQTAAATSLNALIRSVGSSVNAAAIAAAFTLVAVGANGVAHPTPTAFLITFAVSAAGALLSAGISVLVPRDAPRGRLRR